MCSAGLVLLPVPKCYLPIGAVSSLRSGIAVFILGVKEIGTGSVLFVRLPHFARDGHSVLQRVRSLEDDYWMA